MTGALLLMIGGTASALIAFGLIEADFVGPHAAYGTVSFGGGFVLTALALCWAAYQLRLRHIARSLDARFDERASERMRIARELHDTLLQSFQGLMLRFQTARELLPLDPQAAAEALDGALDRADRALVEGRDAIQNLRSSTPAAGALAESIAALADELRGTGDEARPITFRASVEGTPRGLHPLLRDDVYRIAREALCNAYRHSHARNIEAEIAYAPRELRVRIRDDGRGIEPHYLRTAPARHWGLTSMRERARDIGAELIVWSRGGAGTEVELRIPGRIAFGTCRRRNVFRRTPGSDWDDER
jgi:signal transduction histidine kinase